MQTLASEHPDLDFGKHVIPSMVESHRHLRLPLRGLLGGRGHGGGLLGDQHGAGLAANPS